MEEHQKLFAKVLGRHLYIIRKIDNDLTLEKLAELIDMDDKHLGGLERGESIPSAYTLYKMSENMKMSIKNLFEDVKRDLEINQNDDKEQR